MYYISARTKRSLWKLFRDSELGFLRRDCLERYLVPFADKGRGSLHQKQISTLKKDSCHSMTTFSLLSWLLGQRRIVLNHSELVSQRYHCPTETRYDGSGFMFKITQFWVNMPTVIPYEQEDYVSMLSWNLYISE